MSFLFNLHNAFGGLDGADPSSLATSLAFELPHWITPTIAGLTVGAFVGVIGFVAVLLLVGRKPQRRIAPVTQSPDNVVYIPPYATLHRDTPVPPPWMGSSAPAAPRADAVHIPPLAPLPVISQVGFAPISATGTFHASPSRGAPPLRPTTELSARVFAKMGYAVDAPPPSIEAYADLPFVAPSAPALPVAAPAPQVIAPAPDSGLRPEPAIDVYVDAPDVDPEVSLNESHLEEDEELAVAKPVSVQPVLFAVPPSALPTVRHPSFFPPSEAPQTTPASGVKIAGNAESSSMRARAPSSPSELPPPPPVTIPPRASTVAPAGAFEAARARGASIADLDLEDNAATTVCETLFDEPPQPRRRTDPPRIRQIQPAGPRYAANGGPVIPRPAPLPRVTPPPGRVRRAQ